ncbi:MAG: hypothetical protein NTY19_24450 [Planctomycetota bacterium]|nr:hypothetical protein [Planctomycetota bacterium]
MLRILTRARTGTYVVAEVARLRGFTPNTRILANSATTAELAVEARTILFAAWQRGAIEIKGVNDAFDSSERFLAICVELDAERHLVCRRRDEPELTIRFLDAFRQLCVFGLVMHHLFREFSLTRAGFELARTISRQEVQILEQLAEEDVLGDL